MKRPDDSENEDPSLIELFRELRNREPTLGELVMIARLLYSHIHELHQQADKIYWWISCWTAIAHKVSETFPWVVSTIRINTLFHEIDMRWRDIMRTFGRFETRN